MRYQLQECSLAQLHIEVVTYCSIEERRKYTVKIDNGLLYRTECKLPVGSDSECDTNWTYSLIDTGPDGWIFVLRDGVIYANTKETKKFPRFHHSSFVAGEDVEAAGMFVCEHGKLTCLFPHSGHYRPTGMSPYLILITHSLSISLSLSLSLPLSLSLSLSLFLSINVNIYVY